MLDPPGRDLSSEAPPTSTGAVNKSRSARNRNPVSGWPCSVGRAPDWLARLSAGRVAGLRTCACAGPEAQHSRDPPHRQDHRRVASCDPCHCSDRGRDPGARLLAVRRVRSLAILLQHMAEVIESARPHLPPWAGSYVPADPEELKAAASAWLREHAGQLRLIGEDVWRILMHIVVGMISEAWLPSAVRPVRSRPVLWRGR